MTLLQNIFRPPPPEALCIGQQNHERECIMYWTMFFVSLLVSVSPAFATVRNQINGADNNVWRAERGANNNITVYRNDIAAPQSLQTGGSTLSTPAMARRGNTLYVIVRGDEGNNAIWCNSLSFPYTNWSGWVYVNGLTLDAPTAASNAFSIWASVRGIDNKLYYRNINACPTTGAWTATGKSMQVAPEMVGDLGSFRIAFLDDQDEFRLFTLGSSQTPRARSFGSDKDMHAVNFRSYNALNVQHEADIGKGPLQHKLRRFGDARNPLENDGVCDVPHISGMNRGSPFTSVCYGGESITGDSVINLRLNQSFVGNAGQYSWRSCMIGIGIDVRNDSCDLLVPDLLFFPNMAETTQARLRANITIPNSALHDSSSSNNSSALGLSFFLKPGPIISNSSGVQMVMIVYRDNQNEGCKTATGTLPDGSGLFNFTPRCISSSLDSIQIGEKILYDVNLRSYINSKIQDRWQDQNGNRLNQFVSYVPSNWRITWGVGVFLDREAADAARAVIDDVSFEVLF